MVVLLFGLPGSGKGTQASRLGRWLGVPWISTGEMLREEAGRDTRHGRELALRLARGHFVSDDTVNRIVAGRLEHLDCPGVILDGYPRTLTQALFLDDLLLRLGLPPALTTYLDISQEVAGKRLIQRRHCSRCPAIYHLQAMPPRLSGVCDDCGSPLFQRTDDHPEAIAERFRVYSQSTAPVVEYYRPRGLLHLDGNRSADEIFALLRSAASPGVSESRHPNLANSPTTP